MRCFDPPWLRRFSLGELASNEKSLLKDLSAVKYLDHRARVPKRAQDTCEWFLRHPKYTAWRNDQNSSLLWYSADPGCGKSVLSSYLIEELKSSESQATLPGMVCYFFFRDDNEAQKKATNAFCALLHQILTKHHDLFGFVMPEYEEWGGNIGENFDGLWTMISAVTSSNTSANIIFILDGLDECECESRKRLLDTLAEYFSSAISGNRSTGLVKCLVTSRPYTWIERSFYSLPEIRLKGENEIQAIDHDIASLIHQKLTRITAMKNLTIDTKRSLRDKLNASAGHTFLWVALVLEMIENASSASANNLAQIFCQTPPSLDALYEKILNMSPDPDKTRKVLHIMLAASWPLGPDEMNVALHIDYSHKSYSDVEQAIEPNIENTIKDLCGLLVRYIDGKFYFVHQTVSSFLLQEPSSEVSLREGWKHCISSNDCHLTMARACVAAHLISLQNGGPRHVDICPESITEFQGYASRYWVWHSKVARSELDNHDLERIVTIVGLEVDDSHDIHLLNGRRLLRACDRILVLVGAYMINHLVYSSQSICYALFYILLHHGVSWCLGILQLSTVDHIRRLAARHTNGEILDQYEDYLLQFFAIFDEIQKRQNLEVEVIYYTTEATVEAIPDDISEIPLPDGFLAWAGLGWQQKRLVEFKKRQDE